MESMERHLLDNGYDKFNIRYYESSLHTATGTGYVIDVTSALANYVPFVTLVLPFVTLVLPFVTLVLPFVTAFAFISHESQLVSCP